MAVSMQQPLLNGDGASLPSAPPMPVLITDAECSKLVANLKALSGNGFEDQLRMLRIDLFGKLIHQGHAMQLLQEIDPNYRAQALREFYERQLLIDSSSAGPSFLETLSSGTSMGLTETEATSLKTQVEATAKQAFQFLQGGQEELVNGFDLNAVPSAPPADFVVPEPSAPPMAEPSTGMQQAVLLMHFDGKITAVVGDASRMTITDVMNAGSQYLNVSPYDPSRHYALMVWPGKCHVANINAPIGSLGIPPWARILWLEFPFCRAGEKIADPRTAGYRFQHIHSTFFAVSQSNQMMISKAELRNFFWNLNLTDDAFAQIWDRFDARHRGFLDIDDLLHLLGRAHMQYPMVPIDALLYEAASLILNGGQNPQLNGYPGATHFDIPVAVTPHGIGVGGAMERHFCSYFFSILLQIAVPVLIVLALLAVSDGQEPFIFAAAGLYVLYLVHSFCCSKFLSAVGNRITGLDSVCNAMERPKSEHPVYHWHIQCYHMETRTKTENYTDSEGNQKTRTVTETVRVNTWSNRHSGIIPSVDATPMFQPDTTALMTEIDTELDLDLTHSNYVQCYRHWCLANRFDVHADTSRSEDLPSRKSAVLAEWVSDVRPCWVRKTFYVLATLFLCSMCFRLTVQARSGYQKFTYKKRCYQIEYYPPSRCHAGAAAAIAGISMGLTLASVMGGAVVW
jgi:hypothetical protein